MEVAGRATAVSSSAVVLTLIPIPAMMPVILFSSSIVSASTPAIFFPPARISFGHLIHTAPTLSDFKKSAIGSESSAIRQNGASPGAAPNKTDKARFLSFTSIQLLPWRPRPALWRKV